MLRHYFQNRALNLPYTALTLDFLTFKRIFLNVMFKNGPEMIEQLPCGLILDLRRQYYIVDLFE